MQVRTFKPAVGLLAQAYRLRIDHIRLMPAVAKPASMKAFMFRIAPVTKAAVTEMIITNLDYFGRSHGFRRPNGFSAPAWLLSRLLTVERRRLLGL
jgi:hypothetical protein